MSWYATLHRKPWHTGKTSCGSLTDAWLPFRKQNKIDSADLRRLISQCKKNLSQDATIATICNVFHLTELDSLVCGKTSTTGFSLVGQVRYKPLLSSFKYLKKHGAGALLPERLSAQNDEFCWFDVNDACMDPRQGLCQLVRHKQ